MVNVAGTEILVFWSSLVLLGLGWNFMFVGGSALLTECYGPEERAKVQALNEFLIFATVSCTALLSGMLFNALGWAAVNMAVVVPVLLALSSVLWLGRKHEVPAV